MSWDAVIVAVVMVCLVAGAWLAVELGIALWQSWVWHRRRNTRGGRLVRWMKFHGGVR